MIELTPSLSIDEGELQFDFIRAAGPGGQNVNKVATACQLRFNIPASASLAPEVKARLVKLGGSRVTAEGVLIIEARRYRTQEQNRFDALQRLGALIQKALEKPKARIPVKPSGAGRARDKQHRSAIKKTRGSVPEEWE